MANEHNHGGKREGAGRPKGSKGKAGKLKDNFLEELVAAEAEAVRAGAKSLAQKAIELALCDDKRVSASVMNKLLDKLLTSKTESDVKQTVSGPTIFLPEKRPEGEAVDIDAIRKDAHAKWASEAEEGAKH